MHVPFLMHSEKSVSGLILIAQWESRCACCFEFWFSVPPTTGQQSSDLTFFTHRVPCQSAASLFWELRYLICCMCGVTTGFLGIVRLSFTEINQSSRFCVMAAGRQTHRHAHRQTHRYILWPKRNPFFECTQKQLNRLAFVCERSGNFCLPKFSWWFICLNPLALVCKRGDNSWPVKTGLVLKICLLFCTV